MKMALVNRQPHRLRRLLLLSVKIFIAGVGLWYVISRISWHDRVFVAAGSRIRGVTILDTVPVRVLDWQHGMPQVLLAGQKITVHLASGQVVTGVADDPPIGLPKVAMLPVADLVHTHGRLEIRRGLIGLIKSARPWPLLAALLLLGLPTFIITWRWRKLLGVQQLPLSYGKCLMLTFVGQFYSTFLPGSISGDVVKVVYTGRMTAQPTKVAVTVLLDRVIGLIALMLVAIVALTIVLMLGPARPSGGAVHLLLLHILWILGGALVAACAGAAIYFYRQYALRKHAHHQQHSHQLKVAAVCLQASVRMLDEFR